MRFDQQNEAEMTCDFQASNPWQLPHSPSGTAPPCGNAGSAPSRMTALQKRDHMERVAQAPHPLQLPQARTQTCE